MPCGALSDFVSILVRCRITSWSTSHFKVGYSLLSTEDCYLPRFQGFQGLALLCFVIGCKRNHHRIEYLYIYCLFPYCTFLSVFSIQKSYHPPSATQWHDPIPWAAANEDEQKLHTNVDTVSRWPHPGFSSNFSANRLWCHGNVRYPFESCNLWTSFPSVYL